MTRNQAVATSERWNRQDAKTAKVYMGNLGLEEVSEPVVVLVENWFEELERLLVPTD